MRSVESIVGIYLRNQNQYINHFTTLCFWKSLNHLGSTEGLGIEEKFLHWAAF